MARGRFISESVATDARLNSLSVEAELVYLMTIPHLDRDGLIDGDPNVLWGKVCPKRRQFLDTIAVYIQEWAKAGLVLMYDTDNGPVLWFKGFIKNQLGLRYDRETPSKFPPPPVQNEVRQLSGNSPATGGESSAQCQVEVKDQLEDQGRDAREAAPPAKPTPPPVGYQMSTAPGEYIPGVGRPRYNQDKRVADQYSAKASSQGVGPEPFRLMIDAVLSATGKTALANTSGELGQQTLNQAKETVVSLLEMGRRTLEEVQEVLISWRENDWRGASPPSFGQIVEHASAMAAGTHRTARRQDSSKKEFTSMQEYNEWARRNDPQCKRIAEGIVVRGTAIKRNNYQLPVAH